MASHWRIFGGGDHFLPYADRRRAKRCGRVMKFLPAPSNDARRAARLRFGHDGVKHKVGVKLRRSRNGGFWATLMCPRCDGGFERLRLLDGAPACVKASARPKSVKIGPGTRRGASQQRVDPFARK
jgi:hypothetical protein